MSADLLDLYRKSSEWTGSKVAGITDLDAPTPCEEWTARDVLNHIVETQHYFVAAASGQDVAPPGKAPVNSIGNDPATDLSKAQAAVVETFSPDGVIEKTGPSLGIAFCDQLIHGWDLAKASGQDATMPEGLAQAAYDFIHGKFGDQRAQFFKDEVPVGEDATPQQRLLGYTGRNPD
ncbi:MAG: TIGR03086 family protein [Frankiaceae bacterium]|nr:TIGR03086 family protein [Frankiaceae bacterium]